MNLLREDIKVDDKKTTIERIKTNLERDLDPITGSQLFIDIASLFDNKESLDLALKTANLKRVK